MSHNRLRIYGMVLAAGLCSFIGGFLFADEPVQRPTREEIRRQLRPPRLAGRGAQAADSDAFQVQYTLSKEAKLSVTLLDIRRMPIRTFQVPAGSPGTAAGENRLTIWDGKDAQGNDAPPGEYWAALSIQDADGALENKRFRLVKP
ncbi:MAG: hypothetical protein HY548_08940 [Elusimicrobia bacterium]|nr:hypothetical protein [Elusimicrobiota bacterium]